MYIYIVTYLHYACRMSSHSHKHCHQCFQHMYFLLLKTKPSHYWGDAAHHNTTHLYEVFYSSFTIQYNTIQFVYCDILYNRYKIYMNKFISATRID